MRKERAVSILAAALIAAMTPQYVYGAVKETQTMQADENKGYEFLYGTTRIALNQDAALILSALGKAERVFEQDSCAYQGKDKVYSYNGFELSTYPVNKKDCVASVYLINDKVQTEEGIKIGSTYDEMIKAYGKDYKMENQVYRYVKNGTELAFYMTDYKVDGIEYTVAAK